VTYRTFGGTPDVVATDASGNVTAAPVLKVYTTRTGSTQPPLKDTAGNPVTTVSPISSGPDLGLIEFQADADTVDYLWLDRQDGSRRMRVGVRDGSGLSDNSLAALVATPTSASRKQLDATYARAGIDSTQRLMAQLDHGTGDVHALFIGDSTGNEASEWIYLLSGQLAADYPALSVQYHLINDTTGSYDAAVTIQTGTGSRTLHIWNCSVAGATTRFFTGTKFAYFSTLNPVLTVISLGHNEGSIDYLWHPQYAGFVEAVAEALPFSSIMLVAQNPETANTYQQQRTEVYREYAGSRGYGFVDITQAFLTYPSWQSALIAVDGIHPNPTGSQFWADSIHPAFAYQRSMAPRPQQPSTITAGGEQLLTNGDFADFAGAIPTGWVANGTPTATKDTSNYESANGYAVTVTSVAAGDYLRGDLPISRVKGKWISLLARVYVGASQANTAGRIAIIDSLGNTTSQAEAYGRGAYRWIFLNRYIDPAATYARVVLYGDSAGGGGQATYDIVSVSLGKLPRRAANGARGVQGPAGVVAGQIDFMSTFGSFGPFLWGSSGSVAGTIANAAILTEFRPHRDVTVTSLAWMTGATPSGNYDIGIYSAAGTRLWSKGSTAWPAASTRVVETVSPGVAMTAGTQYFIAFVPDNTTGLFRGQAESFTDQVKSVTGQYLAKSVASSFPLPASLTVGNTRAARYPAISVHGT
jgi:hypothetical protein